MVPNTALAYILYVWLLGRMTVVEFTFGTIANPIAGILCAGILINEQYAKLAVRDYVINDCVFGIATRLGT